ncbi:MAG TPA: flagellar basal body rod protein FlgB [Candidatus Tetragenococcus pullicola]|nr:flagellar basal body rod protein FlgB [Candidatus Tetragenococcus pullicola]
MDTYELLKTSLSVSNKRSELTSTNIANINTPDYKAKRIQFESNLKKIMSDESFTLTTTNKKHLPSNQMIKEPEITQSQASLKENGNNVDLDVEMTNQAINGLYYNALTAQLNGRLKMMNVILRS